MTTSHIKHGNDLHASATAAQRLQREQLTRTKKTVTRELLKKDTFETALPRFDDKVEGSKGVVNDPLAGQAPAMDVIAAGGKFDPKHAFTLFDVIGSMTAVFGVQAASTNEALNMLTETSTRITNYMRQVQGFQTEVSKINAAIKAAQPTPVEKVCEQVLFLAMATAMGFAMGGPVGAAAAIGIGLALDLGSDIGKNTKTGKIEFMGSGPDFKSGMDFAVEGILKALHIKDTAAAEFVTKLVFAIVVALATAGGTAYYGISQEAAAAGEAAEEGISTAATTAAEGGADAANNAIGNTVEDIGEEGEEAAQSVQRTGLSRVWNGVKSVAYKVTGGERLAMRRAFAVGFNSFTTVSGGLKTKTKVWIHDESAKNGREKTTGSLGMWGDLFVTGKNGGRDYGFASTMDTIINGALGIVNMGLMNNVGEEAESIFAAGTKTKRYVGFAFNNVGGYTQAGVAIANSTRDFRVAGLQDKLADYISSMDKVEGECQLTITARSMVNQIMQSTLKVNTETMNTVQGLLRDVQSNLIPAVVSQQSA